MAEQVEIMAKVIGDAADGCGKAFMWMGIIILVLVGVIIFLLIHFL